MKLRLSTCLSGLLALTAAGAGSPAWAQSSESLPAPPTYNEPTYQPPPPPAPDYSQPGYAQPPPQPYYAPPPQYRLVRFRPQFGLGLRGAGIWNDAGGGYGHAQGGVGLDLLLRFHPYLASELSFQYQADSGDALNGVVHTYLPLTLGLRAYVLPMRSPVAPYFVAALGGTYGRVAVPACTGPGIATPGTCFEDGWLVELQGGGGVEVRFGRHFTLNADLRILGRIRADAAPAITVSDAYGNSVPALGNTVGVQGNLGFGVYF